MIGLDSAQTTGVTIEAEIWPACVCGCPHPEHTCVTCGGLCAGYRPSRPVQVLGTRAFSPRPSLPAWRRLACRAAWACEARLQGWRERLNGGTA